MHITVESSSTVVNEHIYDLIPRFVGVVGYRVGGFLV